MIKSKEMILEICAGNYQSAINAEKSGAHRIELCAELNAGGLTPSYGLSKKYSLDFLNQTLKNELGYYLLKKRYFLFFKKI